MCVLFTPRQGVQEPRPCLNDAAILATMPEKIYRIAASGVPVIKATSEVTPLETARMTLAREGSE
jgi:hypothetical protein